MSEAIKENLKLEVLILHSNQIKDEGSKSLSEALEKNSTLNTLDLSNNDISDAGASYLGKSLIKNNNLKLFSLILKKNKIGISETINLHEILKFKNPFPIVNLKDNEISEEEIIENIPENQWYRKCEKRKCHMLAKITGNRCRNNAVRSGLSKDLICYVHVLQLYKIRDELNEERAKYLDDDGRLRLFV